MQWIITVCALLLLLMLALKSRRPIPDFPLDAAVEDSLSAHLSSAVQQAHVKGRRHIRLRRAIPVAIEKELVFLLSIPKEERLPAADLLCQSARLIQQEAQDALHDQKGIPSLPCTDSRQPRVCLFAHELIRYTTASLDPDGIRRGVQAWQSVQPLTEAELTALPDALRLTLLELVCTLARQCAHDQRSASSQDHTQQTRLIQWTSSAISSLRTLGRMPWESMLESMSIIHRVLQEDPVYPRMTPASRSLYRKKLAQIARRTRRSEQAVASVLNSLCRNAEVGSLESHTGYYLLDDGYSTLLHQLQALTFPQRLRIGMRRHSCGLYRLASWLFFLAGLLFAWRAGLSAWLWLPAAALWLYGVRQIGLALLRKRKAPFLPRMQVDHLSEENAVLVVCPAVLESAEHAIRAAKHLSIQQKANPDPQIHFLLLGEFTGAEERARSSDAEIMAAASASISALREDSGRGFLYLQRERTSAASGVVSLMRLIDGKSADDRYAFASEDLSWFSARYRCVIAINEETLLPPDSVLQMTGAMLHPLHQNSLHGRQTRGFSAMQPRVMSAPHQWKSRLSAFWDTTLRSSEEQLDQSLFHRSAFQSSGILDPAAQEMQRCAYLGDVILYSPPPQTLEAHLRRQHSLICRDWSEVKQLLSFSTHRRLDVISRFQKWRRLFETLMPSVQLLLMLYAAISGRLWLWLTALLVPWGDFKTTLAHLLILPCTAYTSLDAVIRTLWHQFSGRELPPGWSFITKRQLSDRSPMLFFALNMGGAGLFAALVLLPSASAPVCWITAAGWALFAFVLPFLEQDRALQKQPTTYMHEVLMRTAKNTLAFFETAITESDHALPPEQVQIDPNKGIRHRTTPEAIGFYLCGLISAQKLGLLSAQEAAQRMTDCICSLEQLPKWKGLLYDNYDTRTLQPSPELFVSSESCGILTVCLLTAAQGVRAMLAQLPEAFAGLSARMDALAEQMQLEVLYNREAKLFYTGIHAADDRPSQIFQTRLLSVSRLLSFAAIMLGKVPKEHWDMLSHGMLSRFGSIGEYMTPLLFQPLIHNTLLDSACRKALVVQRKHRLGGAYGISTSACASLDDDLWYRRQAFGIPSLALEADVACNALSPHAAFLSFPLNHRRAFGNVQRLEILGMQGPLGFFDAADFAKSRTEGASMKIVRSYSADHQAMILCAICNILCSDYLVSLFSELPRVQAYRLLLEEQVPPVHSRSPRPFRVPDESAVSAPSLMKRQAQPLHFPIDAHVLRGANTSWLIDAQGGGYLKDGETLLTRFHESCHLSGGMRIYLRDSQSGAYWMAADPWLMDSVRFETAQAVFTHERFDLACEMRMWINPLDGSAIHHLTLENKSGAERLMELCSYLEPAGTTEGMRLARMNHHGISLQSDGLGGALQHLFLSDAAPSVFRIQCERSAFIGRGRSFYAPRALEMPISAVADWIKCVQEPCMSLRAQVMLRAGETQVFCFVTHLAEKAESASSFCERYSSTEAVSRTYETAQTAASALARFISADPDLQMFASRLTGILAYTGQPWQNAAADTLHAKILDGFGLDPSFPILLTECGADTDRTIVAQLLKAHAYLHRLGLTFDLVFALRVRTRASTARDTIEEEIDLSHSRQWSNQRGGVFLIERMDEDELSLLRWSARLTLYAGQPLEGQLDALSQSVRARPVYLPRPDTEWKSELPRGEELLLFNGYGGFTKADGHYQILLSPGAQTPAPWCNPLCSPSFVSLAGESGLLSGEAFYLRDEEHQLLWSPTRQPIGNGMPVRITHAPGETIYENAAYGLMTRIHCASDPVESAGLRMIHLKNEDTASRSFTLFYTCLFPETVRLQRHDGSVIGWDPYSGQSHALFAMDERQCESYVMSTGALQGLWSRLPLALSTQTEWTSSGGSASVLAISLTLSAGESVVLSYGTARSESAEAMELLLQKLRAGSMSERLREVRRFWNRRLDTFLFDLPNPALSLLLSRWLPYQAITAQMYSDRFQPSNMLPSAYSQPYAAQPDLMKTEPEEPSDNLLTLFTAVCCACISGEPLPQAAQFAEAIQSITLGAHDLPVSGTETVWRGMVLCETIRRLTPFCAQETGQALAKKRSTLLEAVDRYAWDGSWYLYGWDEEGRAITRLDAVTQCWAVMCGVSRDRCEIAMENLWRALRDPSSTIGQLSSLTRFWIATALHQLGQTERAWELVDAILPTVHTSTRQLADRYRTEPYALADNGHTWFWEGVGWCWQMVVEQMLGFRKAGSMLRFIPVVPSQWERVGLTYRFGSATYHLHASRDCAEPMADGKKLTNGILMLADDGRIHEAFFPLR